jgi:hypothetical protein
MSSGKCFSQQQRKRLERMAVHAPERDAPSTRRRLAERFKFYFFSRGVLLWAVRLGELDG